MPEEGGGGLDAVVDELGIAVEHGSRIGAPGLVGFIVTSGTTSAVAATPPPGSCRSRSRRSPAPRTPDRSIRSTSSSRGVAARVGRNTGSARHIMVRLRRDTPFIPTTTVIDGTLPVRPCFVNPRTRLEHVDGLVGTVLHVGDDLTKGRGGET